MHKSTPTETPIRLLHSRQRTTELMGIGLTTLDTLIGQGKLKRVKIGRRSLITDASIRRLIAEQSGEVA